MSFFASPAQATFPGRNGKIAYNTSWVGPHTYYLPPDVWTVDPDGSGHTRLTTDEISSQPIWSPDGAKIAFIKYSADRDLDAEIYSMNADGTDVKDLTNSIQNDTQQAWSPDGRKIVFVSDRNEPAPYDCYATTGICNYEIYSMNADGSGLQRLTNSPNIDTEPAWSPDGKKIVFASFRNEPDPLHCYQTACNYEIYTVNADGSGLSRVTNESSEDRQPLWSPQSGTISFERNRGSYYYEPQHLYLIGADGSGEHRLIDGLYNEKDAAWSPDGTRIAFESIEQIHATNPDGSGHVVLVNDIVTDPNDPRYYSAIYNSHPTWSPDGTKVAYSHDECPYYCDYSQLQTVNADGSGRTTISGNAAVSPDWQPLPGPQRSDYKNAAKFCKALREFLGDEAFRNRYGGGANAHGKCVSGDGR